MGTKALTGLGILALCLLAGSIGYVAVTDRFDAPKHAALFGRLLPEV